VLHPLHGVDASVTYLAWLVAGGATDADKGSNSNGNSNSNSNISGGGGGGGGGDARSSSVGGAAAWTVADVTSLVFEFSKWVLLRVPSAALRIFLSPAAVSTSSSTAATSAHIREFAGVDGWWCDCSCDVHLDSLLCCLLGCASALVTSIRVLCTLRTQILRSICNSVPQCVSNF
jgi:hypothetical protein